MRIGFQTRVLVPVILILCFLLGGTLLLVNQHVREEFNLDTTSTLEIAERVLKNSYDIRLKHLSLRFRGVANEPRFKAVSQLGDPATMRSLLRELLQEHQTSLALFISSDGRVREVVSLDPELPAESFESASELVCQEAIASRQIKVDLVLNGRQLVNVVAVPSIIGDRVNGVLAMGVVVGKGVLADLKRLTRCELILRVGHRVVASTLNRAKQTELMVPAAESDRLEMRTLNYANPELLLEDEHFLRGTGLLATLNPELQVAYDLLFSYETPLRKMHHTQRQLVLCSLLGILLSLLTIGMVVRGVTQPLRALHEAAERIGSGDFSSRVPVQTMDECGELAAMFNQMTEKLSHSHLQLQEAKDLLEQRVEERTAELTEEIKRRERIQVAMQEAQRELVEVSRKAGMAEIATGVLHNVGNVLNSLNVSASLLNECLRNSKSHNLTQVANLLREHRDHLGGYLSLDSKGSRIPAYIEQLAEHLLKEKDMAIREMAHLQEHISHIKRVVAMQQRHAKHGGVMERMPAPSLLEDALQLSSLASVGSSVEVIRDYQSSPELVVDRHVVLQILVNLINNSCHALQSRESGRRLTLRLLPIEGQQVRIEIEDNGCGIHPDNLNRIFQHGFTTKSDGHGFGLHSGAIAARELGGSLTVRSDGVGQGATFRLQLPWSQADATPAAA